VRGRGNARPHLVGAIEGEQTPDAASPVPSSADRIRRRCAARPPHAPPVETGGGDTRDRDGGGPAAPPGAAARRERPLALAPARAAAQRPAPRHGAGGSGAPGAARRARPRLAAGLAERPARDTAAVAPRGVPRLLAAQVAPEAGYCQGNCRASWEGGCAILGAGKNRLPRPPTNASASRRRSSATRHARPWHRGTHTGHTVGR